MTEAEWQECRDPTPMLDFLGAKASNRKLRLFACACCRDIWRLLGSREREEVELAEQVADGKGNIPEDLAEAQSEPEAAARCTLADDASFAAALAAAYASDAVGIEAACKGEFGNYAPCILAERRLQATFVRCIFGNPFRAASLNRSWLNWQGGLLVSMARRMYDSGDLGDVPVLADALEEAGCQDQDILAHCRSGSEHVRGCWVIDLLLGKNGQ